MTNILFCGIGGQGVLKASEICGTAALLQGCHVKKSEVHGMAQRGGSVESHVRISSPGEPIYSPLIIPRNADFLVCFHADEANRLKHYLKPQGMDFLPYLSSFDKEDIHSRFLNTYCLGILSAFMALDVESWISALSTVFRRAQEENRRVFERGRKLGLEENERRTGTAQG
jgi:indolepyruvate ferredoxin oxidoreductase beta subunit